MTRVYMETQDLIDALADTIRAKLPAGITLEVRPSTFMWIAEFIDKSGEREKVISRFMMTERHGYHAKEQVKTGLTAEAPRYDDVPPWTEWKTYAVEWEDPNLVPFILSRVSRVSE